MNVNTATNTMPQMHSDTVVNYVNERQGNRPASLKCSDGNYYTISDAACAAYEPLIGQQVSVIFFQNAKGFKDLVSLNNQPMPRDPRRGQGGGDYQRPPPQQTATVQHLPVNPTPQIVPASPAPGQPNRKVDVPPGICGILKSAIEAGLPREEAMKWIQLGLGQDPLGGDEIPF